MSVDQIIPGVTMIKSINCNYVPKWCGSENTNSYSVNVSVCVSLYISSL